MNGSSTERAESPPPQGPRPPILIPPTCIPKYPETPLLSSERPIPTRSSKATQIRIDRPGSGPRMVLEGVALGPLAIGRYLQSNRGGPRSALNPPYEDPTAAHKEKSI